ncbi:MAG: pyridoxamine 5'-phosphate oxidase family protein, partial [Actinomycetes bacterium]
YIDAEDVAIYCHGRVEFLTADHPDFAAVEEHLVGHYGSSPSSWGPSIVYCRVRPTWMVGYAWKRTEILARYGVSEEPR